MVGCGCCCSARRLYFHSIIHTYVFVLPVYVCNVCVLVCWYDVCVFHNVSIYISMRRASAGPHSRHRRDSVFDFAPSKSKRLSSAEIALHYWCSYQEQQYVVAPYERTYMLRCMSLHPTVTEAVFARSLLDSCWNIYHYVYYYINRWFLVVYFLYHSDENAIALLNAGNGIMEVVKSLTSDSEGVCTAAGTSSFSLSTVHTTDSFFYIRRSICTLPPPSSSPTYSINRVSKIRSFISRRPPTKT